MFPLNSIKHPAILQRQFELASRQYGIVPPAPIDLEKVVNFQRGMIVGMCHALMATGISQDEAIDVIRCFRSYVEPDAWPVFYDWPMAGTTTTEQGKAADA